MLNSFTEDSTKAGADEVKFVLTRDSIPYYYSSGWVISDNTFLQSNTTAEVAANVATFTAVGVTTTITMFLHSDTGTSTPAITAVTVNYVFAPVTTDEIHTTILWWSAKTNDAEDSTSSASIKLTNSIVQYLNQTNIAQEEVTITPVNGSYEVEIIDTQTMELDNSSNEQTYTLLIGTDTFKLHIPKLDYVNLYDDGIIV